MLRSVLHIIFIAILTLSAAAQNENIYSYQNWIKEARIKAKIMQFYGEKTMSTNQWKTLDSL
ncbi:MAG: hypothetical protein ABF240_01525, partial [Flavobacteriales bacterium]